MGFYAPAQIVGDARRHGVEVRPVDVNFSHWDCTLEPMETDRRRRDRAALRLGFRQVKGLAARDAEAIVTARRRGYRDVAHLWREAGVGAAALKTLAGADSFRSLKLDRQQAFWTINRLKDAPLPLFAATESSDMGRESEVRLPPIAAPEQVADDYRALRLSLKAHPLSLLRQRLDRRRCVPSERLAAVKSGSRIKVAGLVITRQRPGSANGVMFITLEDETGHANLIIWPAVFERFRQAVLGATLMGVEGTVQREGSVIHVVAGRVWNLGSLLGELTASARPDRAADEAHFDVQSRDFH
jgi:error-prone DNA polymerase